MRTGAGGRYRFEGSVEEAVEYVADYDDDNPPWEGALDYPADPSVVGLTRVREAAQLLVPEHMAKGEAELIGDTLHYFEVRDLLTVSIDDTDETLKHIEEDLERAGEDGAVYPSTRLLMLKRQGYERGRADALLSAT